MPGILLEACVCVLACLGVLSCCSGVCTSVFCVVFVVFCNTYWLHHVLYSIRNFFYLRVSGDALLMISHGVLSFVVLLCASLFVGDCVSNSLFVLSLCNVCFCVEVGLLIGFVNCLLK